jgi:hypothetical protein
LKDECEVNNTPDSVKWLDDSNKLKRMWEVAVVALFRYYPEYAWGAEKNYEKSQVGRHRGLESNPASPEGK